MTDAERQRLAAILGMLGSDHAGERDSAARQAEAFRRKHGLTWDELISGKTVYCDRVIYRWPIPLWLRTLDTDRCVAILLGAIPLIIVLASWVPYYLHP